MKEVIKSSILYEFDLTDFFEEWSWFKFNHLDGTRSNLHECGKSV